MKNFAKRLISPFPPEGHASILPFITMPIVLRRSHRRLACQVVRAQAAARGAERLRESATLYCDARCDASIHAAAPTRMSITALFQVSASDVSARRFDAPIRPRELLTEFSDMPSSRLMAGENDARFALFARVPTSRLEVLHLMFLTPIAGV